MFKQNMKNAAYAPEYLKQREELEKLLFQQANFTEETEVVVSEEVLLCKKSYTMTQSKTCPYNLGGSENKILIKGMENYIFKSVDDSCNFCKLVNHSNGNHYLIFRRDLCGYSLLEVETLRDFHYYPACALGSSDGDDYEETFIWTDILYNPRNDLMVTYGCYWACPWTLTLVDFKDPFMPMENQVCIDFKKDIGSIIDKNYFWQKNSLIIQSKHGKWNKGCKPKKGQSFNGVYVQENTTTTIKTHKFTETLCRKWLEEGNSV